MHWFYSASFTDVDSRCRMFHIKLMRAARWRGGNEVLAHMFISAPRLICFFHNSWWLDQAEQQPLQKSPSVRLCRVYPVLILHWVFSWIIFELDKVNNGKSWRRNFYFNSFLAGKKEPISCCSQQLQKNGLRNERIYACYWLFTLEFAMELYTKQNNGLWLAGNGEWAALNNRAYWDQINRGYSFRWNWRSREEEMRAYLSKDSGKDFP